VDGGPTQPPNPAGRRALEQEYEQATDAAGAVEDDRTTGAWLLVGCLVVTMSPPCIRTIGAGRFSLTSLYAADGCARGAAGKLAL
jgi:hypothetical protein